MSESDLTTITLTKETRDRLKSYGNKGETWNELVNRVLDELHERSDGYYDIPLEMDNKEFGEISVLVADGKPARAMLNMGTITKKGKVKEC